MKKSTIQEDPAITGRLQKKRQLITVHSGLPTTARSSVLSTVAATRCMFPRTATSMVTVSIWISLLLLHLTSTCNNNVLELGKTYRFSGYDWTACELINNGKTLVIQSHGVTSGAWPGYVMPQFGNGNFYAADIDGEDISTYDDKMQALYEAIKDAEDSSTSYGKGLFLISKEKAGFTEWCEPGSGNYWQALKEASMNYQSFGAADGNASLGTVYVYTDGNQDYDFVVAPAFNLDLSKVDIVRDEIMIKAMSDPLEI